MQQQCAGAEKKKTSLQIIPIPQHILDNYDILTILEKNQLWKLVLKEVTVYRSQEDDLSIQLYPNLPNNTPFCTQARLHKAYIFTEIPQNLSTNAP